jgi:hypothetical protein
MRTAGELLPLILDEKIIKKAQTHSALASSWAGITERNKIPAAADHSRILDLDHGVLHIETDHPGWLQIFQIKQDTLLTSVKARFPDLAISGIAFRLSRLPLGAEDAPEGAQEAVEAAPEPPEAAAGVVVSEDQSAPLRRETVYDRITDEDFKASLKRLEQSILSKDAKRKHG